MNIEFDLTIDPTLAAKFKETAPLATVARKPLDTRATQFDVHDPLASTRDERRRDATKHLIKDRKEAAYKLGLLSIGSYIVVKNADAQSIRNVIYRHREKFPTTNFKTELFRFDQMKFLKVIRLA